MALENQPEAPSFESWLDEGRKALLRSDWVQARHCFAQAALLQPDSPLPDFFTAQSYLISGMYFTALDALMDALEKAPEEGYLHRAFADCVRSMHFFFAGMISPRLEKLLLQAMDWPRFNSSEIFSLSSYVVRQKLQEAEQPQDLTLLVRMLEKNLLTDPVLELFVREMRTQLLARVLSSIPLSLGEQNMAGAIATQVYYNEYLWPVSHEEQEGLETILQSAPSPDYTLAYAMFRPLSGADSLTQYLELYSPEQIPESLQRCIRLTVHEPAADAKWKEKVQPITAIRGKTSVQVQRFYESYPYPRWPEMNYPVPTVFDAWRTALFPQLPQRQAADKPSILVAGCGTGRHALQVAMQHSDAYITAIDLSASSLAFAMRKTSEAGVTNLIFRQGDIMELHAQDISFDLIECVGTLHHLRDPYQGWDILVKRLKPESLMKIGLYSSLARAPVSALKATITPEERATGDAGVRHFRQRLISMRGQPDADAVLLLTESYALSPFRDLFFHPQEIEFSIPRIAEYLHRLGLRFLRFDVSPRIHQTFLNEYGDGADLSDLELWHDFELKNPSTFTGMYQFWCTNSNLT